MVAALAAKPRTVSARVSAKDKVSLVEVDVEVAAGADAGADADPSTVRNC